MSDRYRTPNPRKRPAQPMRAGRTRRVRIAPAAVILIVFAILTAAGSLAAFIIHILPNNRLIDLYEYYPDMSRDSLCIVLSGERLNYPPEPLYTDGNIYLPAAFVKEYLDPYLFFDERTGRVTVTTEDEVIRMTAGELPYRVNNEPMELDMAVIMKGEIFYLPAGLLSELYGCDIRYEPEYKTAIIDDAKTERVHASVTEKKAALRYEANRKSPVQAWLELSAEVVCYEQSGDYTRVRAENGLLGFVLTKQLGGFTAVPGVLSDVPEPLVRESKVRLLWDQIYSVSGNSAEEKREPVDGLTVLSPTWFKFDKSGMNGDIISFADRAYVEWAHQTGYEVWGLVTDNFDSEVSHLILSDTVVREKVIDRLLELSTEYGLDGINIDFENVKKDDRDFYLQFIREFAPFTRKAGLVLSVDMYVPKPYNMYYNHAEVGKSADYVIIMAYDEHHATSPISGPVASIGFVEEGITGTIAMVPPEKVILGLPFYTRVWREERGQNDAVSGVTSRSYGMNRGWRTFTDKGIEPEWDSVAGAYYAEYSETEDNASVVYRSWLETVRSIEEKLKLARQYSLAGIAGWSRGFEDPAVWEKINEYIR